MKKLLASLCLVFFAVSLLPAQTTSDNSPPPTVAQVMQFFELMNIRAQMQNILQAEQTQIKTSSSEMFGKMLPGATAKERTQFQEIMDSTISDMIKNYPIDDVLRDMIPINQKHLTEADLNAVITFYSSPVGQKMLKEMPAMTSEAMRVSFARLQPQMGEMMKKMQSRIQEMVAAEKGQGESGSPEGVAPESPK